MSKGGKDFLSACSFAKENAVRALAGFDCGRTYDPYYAMKEHFRKRKQKGY